MDAENLSDEKLKQTQNLMRIFYARIKNDETLDNEHKESLAYRMAEIMSEAKDLYTKILPYMTDENNDKNMLEIISDFRLHYLNLSDIIQEFDELFLSSIIQEEGSVMPDNDNDEDKQNNEDEYEDEDEYYHTDKDSFSIN